ncbi:MAG: hypothetical protein ACTMKU_01995 [Actinomycetaceae bacterium]
MSHRAVQAFALSTLTAAATLTAPVGADAAALAGPAPTLPAAVGSPLPMHGGEIGDDGASFYLRTASGDVGVRYGRAGDAAYVGDWDGDGVDTLAIRRGATFYVSNSTSPTTHDYTVTYGRAGDDHLVGDWDGDGVDTLAVQRGSYVLMSNSPTGTTHDVELSYGRASDEYLVGDWDGDGVDTLAIHRGIEFHVRNSNTSGPAHQVVRFGRSGDTPVSGDWNGDGVDSIGVHRAAGSTFYLRDAVSSGPADHSFNWARSTDQAFAGRWVPGQRADTVGVQRPDPRPVVEEQEPAAPSGTPRQIGQSMAADRGWTGSQWSCLDSVFTYESRWDPSAHNTSSGAYGIPQALPGSKMATHGSDWRTNPATQIAWGLDYIAGRYSTPCGAWSHIQARGWY